MKEVRLKRIESVIYRELGEMLSSVGRNYFPGHIVSVSGVRVSPDLSVANVYVSIFPFKDADQIMKEIEYNKKEIRYQFAQRVRHQLRKIPELKFFLDDSMELVDKANKILNKDKQSSDNQNNNNKN